MTVGSGPDCDLQLPEGDQVAPTHGRFWFRDGRLMFHHLASAYQTRTNGDIVEWGSLRIGDEIQIRPFVVKFQPPAGGQISTL